MTNFDWDKARDLVLKAYLKYAFFGDGYYSNVSFGRY